MAIKVSLENNFLLLDDGEKVRALNAAWCSIDFVDTDLVITNIGINEILTQTNTVKIPVAEFQDGEGTSITTEREIITYLSNKIG